jgi:hypothetical protein
VLGEGLYILLTQSPTITALLGTTTTRTDKKTGIFPVTLPESTPMPAIVYSDVHGEGVMSMDGPDALQFSRMQFSCYGENYADAKRLAREVRRVLEAFTGVLSEGTIIGNMQRVGEVDAFEEAPFIFQTPVDIAITYEDVGR